MKPQMRHHRKREAANVALRFLWRRHLSAGVRVRGVHFEHKFWQFWTELLYELLILLNKPDFALLCAN